MRAPVPLYCEASAKVADNLSRDQAAERYVDKEWETDGFARVRPARTSTPTTCWCWAARSPPTTCSAEVCRDDEAAWADDDRRVVA